MKIPKEVIRRGRTAKREVGEKGAGGGRKGGGRWEKEGKEVGVRGREVGNSLVGSGRGEICKMGEN